jgi:hypothetical protein
MPTVFEAVLLFWSMLTCLHGALCVCRCSRVPRGEIGLETLLGADACQVVAKWQQVAMPTTYAAVGNSSLPTSLQVVAADSWE